MPLVTLLLICHLLVAVALLGAITHQTLAVWWPVRETSPSFGASYRAVRAAVYTNPIVVLFLVTALMGAFLYPPYRDQTLPWFYAHHLKAYGAVFEFKEHVVALGLGALPLYWYFWKKVPLEQQPRVRAALTAFLAFCVWWSFLDGHVINNARGFGS